VPAQSEPPGSHWLRLATTIGGSTPAIVTIDPRNRQSSDAGCMAVGGRGNRPLSVRGHAPAPMQRLIVARSFSSFPVASAGSEIALKLLQSIPADIEDGSITFP